LSLLQLIRRFKLHVLRKRKLNLFSWGNVDLLTTTSSKVGMKHAFSMNFNHFLEIIPDNVLCVLLHYKRLTGRKHTITEKTR